MSQKCPVGKMRCPFHDAAGGAKWCDTNTRIEGFERCPIPKKRDKRIKADAKDRKKIPALRKKRDELWDRFNHLPRRSSFSGISISGDLNEVQQQLDRLEDVPSKRYETEINIEVG